MSKPHEHSDLFCRLGGEEFAVLLPNTSAEQAASIAQDLCERLAATPLELDDGPLRMTLSAGVASHGDDGERLDELMQAADRRTYCAKRTGRNRVVTEDGLEQPLAAT